MFVLALWHVATSMLRLHHSVGWMTSEYLDQIDQNMSRRHRPANGTACCANNRQEQSIVHSYPLDKKSNLLEACMFTASRRVSFSWTVGLWLATRTLVTSMATRQKGVFVGSGSDGMSDPRITQAILDLTAIDNNKSSAFNVLYLGTATYDLPQFATRQTQCFREQGCLVDCLKLVDEAPSSECVQQAFDQADIIVVGGGNTLYAIDRWKRLGIVPHLQAARDRGVVLTGGSAGAICWFDGGHSDSMDPDTYYPSMMEKYGNEKFYQSGQVEESSTAATDAPPKEWNYIRVPGLGFLPGLVCPHHDRIQSNGLLRADDFDAMLLGQADSSPDALELGIGIDHWAALVVHGDDYRVLSLEGKPGSVLQSDESLPKFSPEAKGSPGIWIKEAKLDGQQPRVESRLLPPKGKLSNILRTVKSIEESQQVKACRLANPDKGPV